MQETNEKKLIFSGIQPTGTFTLGNYIGAIRNWGPLRTNTTVYTPSLICMQSL